MSLTDSVLRTIRRHGMLPAGGRVAVALSGGPDSVALLHLLRALESRGELVVAGAAHFNHQLRAAAAEDEAFCREITAQLGVTLEVGAGDVHASARAGKRSIEDAARRMRYEFLSAAAHRLGADAVAIGHSRDDQAETFLLRVLRGSGTRGLGAIRPKAGLVIRPLLEVSRAELRQFAADEGLTFREDETNADVQFPRNRIRHELLPYLEREFTPGIVEVLAREAALAQDDEDKLSAEAIEKAASVVLSSTASLRIDARELSSLHRALASRGARQTLQRMAGERFVGFQHVQRFLAFVREGAPGQAMSLPGQQAVHHGSTVLLGPEPERGVVVSNLQRLSLSVPGEVVLEGPGIAVSARWTDSTPSGGPGESVMIKGVTGALAVRFRSPGDRFEPPGLGGRSKKLQDYLVDRKVARADRDFLPLVVDDADRIVWVVGHGVAEGVLAPEPSPGVILLKVRRLGGEV